MKYIEEELAAQRGTVRVVEKGTGSGCPFPSGLGIPPQRQVNMWGLGKG